MRHWKSTADRADVDDAALALPRKMSDGRCDTCSVPQEVHIEHALEVIYRRIRNRLAGRPQAREVRQRGEANLVLHA
jgi:hypothetical protein